MKVSILNFNDSFVYNIYSEIYKITHHSQIIEAINIEKHLTFLLNEKKRERHVIVWGPGPGSPQEYKWIFPLIKKALSHENIFNLGICLGHQLIFSALGMDVIKSKRPMHGQTEEVIIPNWDCFFFDQIAKKVMVQRYNSLTVDTRELEKIRLKNIQYLFANHELMGSFFDRTVTFQFHPESIGTSCPSIFFHPIRKYLYNGSYDFRN